jgi:hypothetical protein
MTRFIETENGYVNLDHVKTAKRVGKDFEHRLFDADGESLGVTRLHGQSLEDLTSAVIPAAPGAHAIAIYADEHGIFVSKPAIVGWRLVSFAAMALPVFADDFDDAPMLLIPDADGSLREPMCGSYPDIDAAMAEARSRLAPKAAPRKNGHAPDTTP